MQSVVGIAFTVVGVVLIIFGMQASASLGSRLSELFIGAPSDRTIWLLIAGKGKDQHIRFADLRGALSDVKKFKGKTSVEVQKENCHRVCTISCGWLKLLQSQFRKTPRTSSGD